MRNETIMKLDQVLCTTLSITEQELQYFLLTAPNQYKVYAIPKRTSGKRIIAHPAKKLKCYQKIVVKHLESILPLHASAYAYRKGVSIKDNAYCHLNSRYLLKMDFQNFFYSITPELFFQQIETAVITVTQNDRDVLTSLLFWRPSKRQNGKLVLSVGAPSSPFISNFIMFDFDVALTQVCQQQGITYTRYADDLTFSTSEKTILFAMPALIKGLLLTHLKGHISINEAKTVFTSKAHNRHVTGVTLTNDDTLSIGRKRKRYISSLIHQYRMGQLSPEDIAYLQGLLAFASDVEPEFITRMERKYSQHTISQLRKGVL